MGKNYQDYEDGVRNKKRYDAEVCTRCNKSCSLSHLSKDEYGDLICNHCRAKPTCCYCGSNARDGENFCDACYHEFLLSSEEDDYWGNDRFEDEDSE